MPTLWRPQHIQVDEGVHAVVLRDDHGKAAEHILQSRQVLFHVVLAVHAQLGGAAPAVTTTVW